MVRPYVPGPLGLGEISQPALEEELQRVSAAMEDIVDVAIDAPFAVLRDADPLTIGTSPSFFTWATEISDEDTEISGSVITVGRGGIYRVLSTMVGYAAGASQNQIAIMMVRSSVHGDRDASIFPFVHQSRNELSWCVASSIEIQAGETLQVGAYGSSSFGTATFHTSGFELIKEETHR